MRKCSRWLAHLVAVGITATPFICRAQDAATSRLRGNDDAGETETEEIVVTATRLPIPEDQSPATVSVVTSDGNRAATSPPRGGCVARSARHDRHAIRRARSADVGLHARPAQRAHAGVARWHPDQSGTAGRVQLCRSDGRQHRSHRSRARPAKHAVRTARTRRRDPDFHAARHRFADGGMSVRKAARSEASANHSPAQGAWKQLDYSVGLSRFDTENERSEQRVSEHRRDRERRLVA